MFRKYLRLDESQNTENHVVHHQADESLHPNNQQRPQADTRLMQSHTQNSYNTINPFQSSSIPFHADRHRNHANDSQFESPVDIGLDDSGHHYKSIMSSKDQIDGGTSIPMNILKTASTNKLDANTDGHDTNQHPPTSATRITAINGHRMASIPHGLVGSAVRPTLPINLPRHLFFKERRASGDLNSSYYNVWTPGGHPRDNREVQLLFDLASSLAAFGAPLYRVEHRIANAAMALDIPVSFFSLPSTLMINIGDGGLQHPSRTVFIPIVSNYNMWRLHQVDRLARRLGLIMIHYERAKMKMLKRMRMHESVNAESPESVGEGAANVHTGNDTDGVEHGRASVTASNTGHGHADNGGHAHEKQESEIDMGMMGQTHLHPHTTEHEPRIRSPVFNRSDDEPVQIEEIIRDLAELTRSNQDYSNAVRIIASAGQSSFLALLLFKGSIADGIMSCLLGGMTAALQLIATELKSATAVIIFIAMIVSFVARVAQLKYIWYVFPDSPYGLCHDTVALSALVQYMPGTQFTLAMLELGTDHSVAGAVRMFQATMRSIMLGYGVSFGSRFGIFLLQSIEMWDQNDHIKACPVSAKNDIDWWRIPFFFPMTLSIMIFLKAHRRQWIHMSMSSFVGFVVSVASSTFLTSDLSAALSSFCLGLVSNAWARYRDDIAIASVLSGIFWLVPGSVGIRGAIAAFSTDIGTNGSAFGVEIILRTLSIAVGLYTANAIMFPIAPRRRQTTEDDAMAI